MTTQTGRSWGFWTQVKLGMLADYLDQFVIASKGPRERVYLDAFAGEGHGVDRLTGEEFPGSARIGLEAGAGGGFTRLRFFELDSRAAELESRLHAGYPDSRDIKVFAGDCNEQIPNALNELRDVKWAPTFAFLDPDGMELAWETISALANHKLGYRSRSSPKPEFKVELWMLFPTSGIVRTLALDKEKLSGSDEERADRLFGTNCWRSIYDLRIADRIDAAEAREEYVNLMRWRLQRELGYRFTHPFEVKNTKGVSLYHMIFATDNDAGTSIMEHIYNKAAQNMPEMRKEARDRAQGQTALDIETEAPGSGYRHEPPWEPQA